MQDISLSFHYNKVASWEAEPDAYQESSKFLMNVQQKSVFVSTLLFQNIIISLKGKLHDIYESESKSLPVKYLRTTMSSRKFFKDICFFRSRANRFVLKWQTNCNIKFNFRILLYFLNKFLKCLIFFEKLEFLFFFKH